MTVTFIELTDRLKLLDEITILEVLEISADELVDRFNDKIEDKYDWLIANV